MAYFCEISSGQSIYLDCQNGQTIVTLTSGGVGQQQKSRSRYSTGDWLSPPTITQIANGAIITVVANQGTTYLQVQGSSIALQPSPSEQPLGHSLQLQTVETSSHAGAAPSMAPMQPIQPMASIPPMRLGDMKGGDRSMQMNPMEMRMGNMEMRMGETNRPVSGNGSPPKDTVNSQAEPQVSGPQSDEPQVSPKFCSQCGSKVNVGDRFCSQCGHSLRS